MGKKIESMLEKLVARNVRLAALRCYLSMDIGRAEHVEHVERR